MLLIIGVNVSTQQLPSNFTNSHHLGSAKRAPQILYMPLMFHLALHAIQNKPQPGPRASALD
jgi:hypothetical protein